MTALIYKDFDRHAGERYGTAVGGGALRGGDRGVDGLCAPRSPGGCLRGEFFVRCYFCRETFSRHELDGHHCPGSPW